MIRVVKKPTRGELLMVIGEIHEFIKNVRDTYDNDTDPHYFEHSDLARAENLCIEARRFDAPAQIRTKLGGALVDGGIATRKPSWLITIPVELPSQNEIAANRGGMRFRYKKCRDEAVVMLRNAKHLHGIPDAGGKRKVLITRHYGGRRLVFDYGNLVGGAKPFVDAMVLVKLLRNDSPKWIDAVYDQRRVSTRGGYTTIAIEDA